MTVDAAEPPLVIPPVHAAELDDAALAQLELDVELAAELIELVVKPLGARQAAPPGGWTLAEAHRALAARELAAVQLRYRFASDEWWDTLLRTRDGVRLVRINHTAAVAAPPHGD